MARAQGARELMALAFETVYDTLPMGGFTKMPFASTTLGAEQPLPNSELLGYGRDPLARIKDAVTTDERMSSCRPPDLTDAGLVRPVVHVTTALSAETRSPDPAIV